MALVLEEVVVKDQLMRLLRQLDITDALEEGELLAALQAEGASDPHYRALCARLASEYASWIEYLAGNDRPGPSVRFPSDSAAALAKALVPLLQREGAQWLVKKFGLDGEAPLQTFAQKADLLGHLLGELLACRLMGYKRSRYHNPSVSAEKSGDLSQQLGECLKTTFAVLKMENIPEEGDKAVRAVEDKIVELNKTLPEDYNHPLFDLSTLSPEHVSRLETINDGFKAEYSKRQAQIIDRFRQTLIPLFRVKGVPSEIKDGLKASIDDELSKFQKSHPCDFSTWDIVVARDDLIRQQMERINMHPIDSKGAQPRMKSLVVNVGVYRKGAGARAVTKKEDLPKRSRRRRKWEADDADSLPTNVGIEGEEAGGDTDEEDQEGEPPAHGRGKKEKQGGGGEEEEEEDDEDYDGLTREEKQERRRLANERRERGEKKKADELIKKKTQEPKELSKKDKQFLKQQLKKDKRQQRREKKLEKSKRGNATTNDDDQAD